MNLPAQYLRKVAWRSPSLHSVAIVLLSAGVLFLSTQAKESMYVAQSNPTWHVYKITKMRNGLERGVVQNDDARRDFGYPTEPELPAQPLKPAAISPLSISILADAPDHPRSPPSICV